MAPTVFIEILDLNQLHTYIVFGSLAVSFLLPASYRIEYV